MGWKKDILSTTMLVFGALNDGIFVVAQVMFEPRTKIGVVGLNRAGNPTLLRIMERMTWVDSFDVME